MKQTLYILTASVLIFWFSTDGISEEIKPTELPPEIVKQYKNNSNCLNIHKSQLAHKIEKHDMGNQQILYIIPCAYGAYNIFSKLYLMSNGELEQLFFADYSQSHGWFGTDIIVNFGYEPKNKKLSAFNKSVGHGGCGSAGIWRWKDYKFEMIQFQSWDNCDQDKSPEDWPVIYRKK